MATGDGRLEVLRGGNTCRLCQGKRKRQVTFDQNSLNGGLRLFLAVLLMNDLDAISPPTMNWMVKVFLSLFALVF